MRTVAIPERILMKKAVKTAQFDFRWQRISRLKILWTLRRHCVSSFSRECNFA